MTSWSPLTFLLLLLAASATLSSADRQLIDATCRKTVNYGICTHCINSFPGNENANLHQLSIYMTQCGSAGADILTQSFAALGRNPSETPQLRKAYNDCMNDFNRAESNFELSGNKLGSNDYAGAIGYLKGVVQLTLSCKTEVEKAGYSGSPKPVAQDLRVMINVCDITSKIIELSRH